jgi:hypothetical protein
MRRRTVLNTPAALAAGALALPALLCAQPQAAGAVPVLQPDGPALWLARFFSAGGPLDRHAVRPGSWWQLVYLPLWPGWPVELQLRAQRRGHALQLTALDAAPHEAPAVSVLLPLRADTSATPARWSTRFVLPEGSAVEGLFVRVDLWRADGAAPPPVSLRLRSLASEPAMAAAPSHAARVQAPAGPLTQTMRERGAFRLPVIGVRSAAPQPPWPEEVSR